MASVVCSNPDCPETGVPKDLGALPVEQIPMVRCGGCGGPVAEAPDAPEPEPEPEP